MKSSPARDVESPPPCGGGKLPGRRRIRRTCRVCGKDAYPNYFYCPSCHHRTSDHGEHEESLQRSAEF